jgi:Domain of unknown function (DUF4265)
VHWHRNSPIGFNEEELDFSMEQSRAKVRFQLDPSDWHGHGSETLWAEPVGNGSTVFRTLNSPFFARCISNRDVVRAKASGSSLVLDFIEVIERGGHSTYMILAPPEDARVGQYWSLLSNMGCSYESMHINLSMGRRLLYSVDVPSTADIHEVYDVLQRGEDIGVWRFQAGYAHNPDTKSKSSS